MQLPIQMKIRNKIAFSSVAFETYKNNVCKNKNTDLISTKNPPTDLTCGLIFWKKVVFMQKLMQNQISKLSSTPAFTSTVYPILLMISLSHLLNDTIQSL